MKGYRTPSWFRGKSTDSKGAKGKQSKKVIISKTEPRKRSRGNR